MEYKLIQISELVHEAQSLRSNEANPEYDRALVELVLFAAGMSVEQISEVEDLVLKGS